MRIEELLEICRNYAYLGEPVSSQLHDLVENDESMDEQNPNALRYIADFLDDTASAFEWGGSSDLVDDLETWRDRINNYLENIRND